MGPELSCFWDSLNYLLQSLQRRSKPCLAMALPTRESLDDSSAGHRQGYKLHIRQHNWSHLKIKASDVYFDQDQEDK